MNPIGRATTVCRFSARAGRVRYNVDNAAKKTKNALVFDKTHKTQLATLWRERNWEISEQHTKTIKNDKQFGLCALFAAGLLFGYVVVKVLR